MRNLYGAIDAGTIGFMIAAVIIIIGLWYVGYKGKDKRMKAQEFEQVTLRSLAVPGATVKTIGGIIGKIVEIKTISPKEIIMTLETGIDSNKTTMTFDIAALYTIITLANGTPFSPSMLKPPVTDTTNKKTAITSQVEVEKVAPIEKQVDGAIASEPVLVDAFADTPKIPNETTIPDVLVDGKKVKEPKKVK